MSRPVDRDLVMALQQIKTEALRIHQQRPTLRVDDMINALTFSEGRTLRAAEILENLHKQRTRRSRETLD